MKNKTGFMIVDYFNAGFELLCNREVVPLTHSDTLICVQI